MSTQQHEELRLADTTPSLRGGDWGYKAAAELRRLHAINAELVEALKKCQFALEPYDDIKPRDWKTDRERLAVAHQVAIDALAKAEGREA